jgi:hypothetical protein
MRLITKEMKDDQRFIGPVAISEYQKDMNEAFATINAGMKELQEKIRTTNNELIMLKEDGQQRRAIALMIAEEDYEYISQIASEALADPAFLLKEVITQNQDEFVKAWSSRIKQRMRN